MMVEKVAVRKMLASYERKLKEEIRKIEEEKQRISDAIATIEAKEIWWQSKQYAELTEKYITLRNVLMDIIDMRCDEILIDD